MATGWLSAPRRGEEIEERFHPVVVVALQFSLVSYFEVSSTALPFALEERMK
jgi:hypothetical protein